MTDWTSERQKVEDLLRDSGVPMLHLMPDTDAARTRNGWAVAVEEPGLVLTPGEDAQGYERVEEALRVSKYRFQSNRDYYPQGSEKQGRAGFVITGAS